MKTGEWVKGWGEKRVSEPRMNPSVWKENTQPARHKAFGVPGAPKHLQAVGAPESHY